MGTQGVVEEEETRDGGTDELRGLKESVGVSGDLGSRVTRPGGVTRNETKQVSRSHHSWRIHGSSPDHGKTDFGDLRHRHRTTLS